jgi:NAD(P)-dependent dehydrogenase (short-subunit alcohol dehydrogenase family)
LATARFGRRLRLTDTVAQKAGRVNWEKSGFVEVSAMEPLAGRNVVVTGGTGALGEVVVARLIRAGAICHVPSRGAASAASADKDGRLRVVAGVDLTDEAAVDRFYGAVPELWASVHLAGGFAMAPIAETSRADFLGMIEMNALTAFLCSRAAVGAMRKAGRGGRIVNVSARPGLDPRKGARMAGYAAGKAAVAALTLALAEELKDEHILVNAIAPSTIDTAANRKAMPDADVSKWLAPEAAAEAVLQLVSPANIAISGAVLPLYARA